MIRLWMLLAAAGVAALVGFGGGWKTRDAFCDAAYWKAEADRRAEALRLATQGAELAATLQTQLDAEKETTDELRQAYEAATADRSCPADAADLDGLSRILRGK